MEQLASWEANWFTESQIPCTLWNLSSTSGYSKSPLSFWFPHKNPACTSCLPSPIRATCRSYLILDLITRTILGEEYGSISSSLCILLQSPVTSSLSGPNILLNTLLSNTLSLHSSLDMSDHVSCPYKTSKIIIECHSQLSVWKYPVSPILHYNLLT